MRTQRHSFRIWDCLKSLGFQKIYIQKKKSGLCLKM
ncbi:hypothetical protein MTBSS4_110027 [Magnetospirillum sp. SS-4]|nr:hypothetical protein MTBSS4_110027 [Magnetospirillum sp. SS-4]